MPGKRKLLPIAVSGLLSISPAQAATPPPCPADSAAAGDCTPSDPRLDAGLDWGQCSPDHGFTQAPPVSIGEGRIQISADSAELHQLEQHAIFSGAVEVLSDSRRIAAEQATYDRQNQTLDASGQVYFEQHGLRMAASRASFLMDQQRGSAEQVDYRLIERAARGRADSVRIEQRRLAHLQQVSYTTCPPGKNDWALQASEMDLDRESGEGRAQHVTLSFKGVPIFYTPYASFPIDERRKSGLLPPRFGASDSNGLELSLPYYLNLAPNYDATLTPRLLSKRGLMLGTELRYLTRRHQGELQAEILPSDHQYDGRGNSTRGALHYLAHGAPWPRWRYDLDINYHSDDSYLDDLGDSLAAVSVRHIERRGDLRYQGDSWNLLARVQKYQTIDENITSAARPYSRLPQLLLNARLPQQPLGLDLGLRSEYVYFAKEDAIHGSRIDIQPSVALPLRRSWGYLTPRLSARFTAYDLLDQANGQDETPTRTTTTFSLDGGLFFERETRWLGHHLTQTLEPRLFYLYTPKEEQAALPLFDTAQLDFSFASLFRENRFSGADRIGDANQLTTALTSRMLDDQSGEELLRAAIGQIFYFDDREVQLNNSTPIETDSSAIVAELSARLSRQWRARAGIQWNPHARQQREKSALSLTYRDPGQRILNLAYRHSEGLLEQTDLSARWPITARLHGVARWNYSLLHDQTLEGFAGIEYENCCWITRLVTRHYRNDADEPLNSSLFLQLELRGLTSIGDKIDRFLEQGILGYDAE